MAMMLWRDAAAIVDLLAGRGEHDAGGGKKVSAPGQVLVYLMYRQPFTHARVQEALIVLFGLGALLCLAIVMLAGQFSIHAAQMAAAEAIPVVFLVTTLAASRPTPLPHELLKASVCLLLITTGGLICTALSAMRQAWAMNWAGEGSAAARSVPRPKADALEPHVGLVPSPAERRYHQDGVGASLQIPRQLQGRSPDSRLGVSFHRGERTSAKSER